MRPKETEVHGEVVASHLYASQTYNFVRLSLRHLS